MGALERHVELKETFMMLEKVVKQHLKRLHGKAAEDVDWLQKEVREDVDWESLITVVRATRASHPR